MHLVSFPAGHPSAIFGFLPLMVHFLFIHIDRMGEEGVDEQWEEASYGDEQSWRRVNPFVRGISP
uniref:Transmembrane protein n=1 Tax=Medicago truncatula TaxID=3880 RepID=A2Q4L7_MEDTR|nr:hypothetical protein MtrDRAFT_AC157504g34v2 [Medicago truncatula]